MANAMNCSNKLRFAQLREPGVSEYKYISTVSRLRDQLSSSYALKEVRLAVAVRSRWAPPRRGAHAQAEKQLQSGSSRGSFLIGEYVVVYNFRL